MKKKSDRCAISKDVEVATKIIRGVSFLLLSTVCCLTAKVHENGLFKTIILVLSLRALHNSNCLLIHLTSRAERRSQNNYASIHKKRDCL